MAGTRIEVKLTGLKPLQVRLNELITRAENLEPALQEMGEYLLQSHRERFALEIAPDGTPWEPLAPQTLKRKQGEDRILQQGGYLRDLLSYDINGLNQLVFGTNLEYGATHQYGREDDGIPARPWLGLSTGQWNDTGALVAILKSYFET